MKEIVSSIHAPRRADAFAAKIAVLVELTKPGITSMVAFTTAAGFYMAAVKAQAAALPAAVLGTALLAAGAGVINQYMERTLDALMLRTRNRPLPRGTICPAEAIRFGACLSAAGITVLLFLANTLTAFLGAATFLIYICLYTPLKRRGSHAITIGAVAGAMPPLMGWTAAGGHLDFAGFSLLAILFLWQMPHFFAIGWNFSDDYTRAGFLLPTRGAEVKRGALLYAAALIPVSLIPAIEGLAGYPYAFCALLLDGIYFGCACGLMRAGSNVAARRLFNASLIYLPALFTAMLLARK